MSHLRPGATIGEYRLADVLGRGGMGMSDAVDLDTSADVAACAAFTRDGRHVLVGTARGIVLRFELLARGGK